MKITVEYTEHEKLMQKAFKDTLIGGAVIIGKYIALALIFGGVPLWMLFDYLMRGY